MNNAKIEDLPVNPEQKTTPMVIKNLVDVINDEFGRQQTLYDAQAEQKRETILEQYKAQVGYEALKSAYDKSHEAEQKAQKEKGEALKKLHMKGLNNDGERHCQNGYYGSTYSTQNFEQRQIKKAQDKIDTLLKTVEASGPENVRGKIISRLWLSSTTGEAMVILREVLGNGIIPTLTKTDVKLISN